jgi:hypothetical protein
VLPKGLSQDSNEINGAKNGLSVTKPRDDKATNAETCGAEPPVQPPKSANIVSPEQSNAPSWPVSAGAYIAPTNLKSWAAVCCPSPTQPNSPPSPAPEVVSITGGSIESAQGSANCVDPPKMTPSPSCPPSIDELNEFIHRSGSWANIATNGTSYEGEDAKTEPADQEQRIVPTEADFPLALPSSPQQTLGSSAVSYAKVVQSPSSETMASDCTGTEVPTQLKVSSKINTTPLAGVVVEQRLDNLYAMIRPERQNLFSGPLITITIGSIRVTGIFKRVAMALSSVLNTHFIQNPESIEYHSPAESLEPGAVYYLLNTYPHKTSKEFMVPPVPMQDTFARNVSLLHASRKLGMVRYTREILTIHINYLKEELPSYEEITIVEKMKTSDQDPLWTQMVNHLCHDRFKELIPDPEVFEAFLAEHPHLEEAMRTADEYFAGVAKKKWEGKQAQWQAAEDARRMHWEQIQVERRARLVKEKAAIESVKQKMEAKGCSGLMMATAEEAAFLRKR